jgi:DNA gyrase subunit B
MDDNLTTSTNPKTITTNQQNLDDRTAIDTVLNQVSYEASSITVLEGLEAVRKRPGMYIGNTGKDGLHRCLGEILDNSVDEFMAGHATSMKVKLLGKKMYVADDGRGIPTEIHPKTGKSTIETIMTVLHAGGKFDQKSYQFSGGLHGVGASVVNALSELLEVWILRNGQISYISFSEGKIKTELRNMTKDEFESEYPELQSIVCWGNKSGTIISFQIDRKIMETDEFDIDFILSDLKDKAYLNKGFDIAFEVPAQELTVNYCFPDGIKTYLEDITSKETLISPIIMLSGKAENFELECAMAYCEDYNEKLYAFTNGVSNPEGGAHVTGFKTALTKIINNYATAKGFFKKEGDKFGTEDLKEGMRVVISVKMADPQFTSQSKVKLGSTIARTQTDRIMTAEFGTFFEENPAVAQSIVQKAQLAMKARLAAKAARETVLRKGVLDGMALPGKLADCSEKDPTKCEIFIVEGDSAGGSAKMGRDRKTQAILPLRGKVMNTEKATLERILNYEGIKNMIIAFGTGIGDKFDIEKLRYHKIVLMTDADVDGAHITTLLLTFFYRYMPELIEGGFVYMARPPLYRIKYGKKQEYVYTDEEKLDYLKTLGISEDAVESIEEATEEMNGVETVEGIESTEEVTTEKTTSTKKKTVLIQRYKGLGEMNADELYETTMNIATRMFWQVTIGEAAVANKVFEDLMGAEVEPRKRFIEENAVFAELDIV